MTRRRRITGVGEETRRRHGWLELLQTSGPFLTLPVAHRVFPDGLPPVGAADRAALRTAMADMIARKGATRHDLVDLVLRRILDWGERYDPAPPDSLAAIVVEHHTSVGADFAFTVTADEDTGEPEDESDGDEESDGGGSDGEAAEPDVGPHRLLGLIAPWGSHPLVRTTEQGWTASPAERLAVLLRARDVPIGLVTDGRWWAIVWAPSGGATGMAVWDGALFSEEPDTLRAFTALLHRGRFLGVPRADTLPAMLVESAEKQEELTEQLGEQVRDAVELLLGTLDRLDADSGGDLLRDVDDDELYAGAVTVMMRIMFLLFAEERRLLPADDERYADGYSVGRLVDELRSRVSLAGEQTLEHRTGAWHRLLAVARAVHGGVAHEDLRLPAYGGGLFDPDRHPWLEGRGADRAGRPPAVDDATVLKMLEAVQYVRIDGEQRRLSFRALGVEQIGYVYEGLLELEVRTASETILHLARHTKWPRSKEPCEAGIGEVRSWTEEVPPSVAAQVTARTGWTKSRVERALRDVIDEHLLTDALGGERELLDVVREIGPALRRDDRMRPVITLPGRRFIAPSTRRATTGTHYTPPQLAAEVAIGALEPLVYRPGPLETADRSTWRLRPSRALLDLRIADIAMGSGAFLVAACRWLADRLVEAWTAEGDADAIHEAQHGVHATADAEASPLVLKARRRISEECLYGVDINPLAVEMAKLSMWLVTMDRERPFGFLDDRFVAGDSLLGLATMDQLETLHIDPVAGRRLHEDTLDFTGPWRAQLGHAADLRRQITARPVNGIRDVEHKQGLLDQVTKQTIALHAVADAITGVGVAHAKSGARATDSAFVALSLEVRNRIGGEEDRLRKAAQENLQAGTPAGLAPRSTMHWPLVFPEILADNKDPGFDAIIGNPPFLGGRKISGAVGIDYLAWLQRWDGNGIKGHADLAARFVLRAQLLLNSRGQLGYITTNTLVQGDTLEVGLGQAVDRGLVMRRGLSSHKWPSRSANLEIVTVWASSTPLSAGGELWLDGEQVPSIGSDLEPVGRIAGRPRALSENDDIAFQGHVVLGNGFVLPPDRAQELIDSDPRNGETLFPYMIGKDLNQRPDCSASRWIINFRDWGQERAAQYEELMEIVTREVLPVRARKDPVKYPTMVHQWWTFWRYRQPLQRAIEDLDHVLALSRVGNAVLPVRVPTGPVFSERCLVFALDGFADLAVLSSSPHICWAIRYTSTLRTDINYSASDVFWTLPRPESTSELADLGRTLDEDRRELMLTRGWGLTTTYNHVHSPADNDPAVVNLREIHRAIDYAVLDAYRWNLDLQIGHHPTKIGTRWTVSPAARFELLDLLLEENHRRHAEEQN